MGCTPEATSPAPTADDSLAVVARRDEIVVAYKPARWATEPTPESSECLVRSLERLLGVRQVHAASRLDVGVSGLVLCTTGSAGAKLVEQWRARGALAHQYVGVVAGRLEGPGQWAAPLGRTRDAVGRARAVVGGKHARSALTGFEPLASSAADRTELYTATRFQIATGRMHQIRAHAADAGHPLVGDRRYRGAVRLVDARGGVHEIGRLALHCSHLELEGLLRAEAPAPPELRSLWRLVGGDDAIWP